MTWNPELTAALARRDAANHPWPRKNQRALLTPTTYPAPLADHERAWDERRARISAEREEKETRRIDRLARIRRRLAFIGATLGKSAAG